MKRFFAIALLLAASCKDAPDVSIPPVALGGASGTRLMSGAARNPVEAYDNAYSEMTKLHIRVRENLHDPVNLYGARSALERIVEDLRAMQGWASESDRPKFDKFLKEYSEWQRIVAGGRYGGLTTALDPLETGVKIQLHPQRIEILAEFAKDGSTAKEEPKKADPVVPTPVPKETTPPREEPKRTEPASATPLWMIYAAWKQSHADLVEAYTKSPKGDCAAAYRRVQESLKVMKAALPSERQTKLDVYVDFYKSIADQTKLFTELPPKTQEDYFVGDLKVIATQIEREYAPEKK